MVSTTTFLSDATKFIRNDLSSNITDPISSSRPSGQRFVMTSYPQKPVTYPIITVKQTGPSDDKRLGARSTLKWTTVPIEVRVWARNEKEKDTLAEQVINRLRSNQFGAGSSSDIQGMHDFELTNSVPVDEPGTAGIKSMVMQFSYKFILGS